LTGKFLGTFERAKIVIVVFERQVGGCRFGTDDQDVMIHAIHDEKRAVDFYKKLAVQCGGAPMEEMFKRLYQDEEAHLVRLEEMYESIYMKDMWRIYTALKGESL
jgi:bacterioferritin (cytochrome b1)